jgi:hypothetical protein
MVGFSVSQFSLWLDERGRVGADKERFVADRDSEVIVSLIKGAWIGACGRSAWNAVLAGKWQNLDRTSLELFQPIGSIS